MPTRGQALTTIRLAAKEGRLEVRGHPVQRAGERQIPAAHLLNALANAKAAIEEMPSHRWKVTGPAGNGDTLTAVVILGDPVVVCTMWRNNAD
jgi:hypothetical protein